MVWPRLRDLAKVAAIAVLLGLHVRSFWLLPLEVPSRSMEPALLPGDRLLIDRSAYLALPLLPGDAWPQRGEVVLLRSPQNPARFLVKRCVAFGGESVALNEGRLLVNGAPRPESWARGPRQLRFGSIRVPPGHCFLLGDRWGHSRDSRSWGTVPRRHLLGRAVLITWSVAPPDASGSYGKIPTFLGNSLKRTRWNRILRPVDTTGDRTRGDRHDQDG